MTDFELVKEKDYFELWNRYSALENIYYHKIPANIRNDLFENFQEFKDSCYLEVVKAVDALKLERIKNPETWSFYIQFSFYLKNYTGRKIVKEYIRNPEEICHVEDYETVNGKTLEIEAPDPMNYYEGFYETLNDDEKFLFDSRLSGKKWNEINIKNIRNVRESLKNKIKEYYY